jgi:hypothetical protein
MPAKKFQKKVEDFVCEKCGEKNIGNGFTNHCRKCLWSKHVDVNPGDRAEKCSGMMMPVRIDLEKGKYLINHKCIKCGMDRRKMLEKSDDFDAAVEITRKLSSKN